LRHAAETLEDDDLLPTVVVQLRAAAESYGETPNDH
jgi:hypothetical protein